MTMQARRRGDKDNHTTSRRRRRHRHRGQGPDSACRQRGRARHRWCACSRLQRVAEDGPEARGVWWWLRHEGTRRRLSRIGEWWRTRGVGRRLICWESGIGRRAIRTYAEGVVRRYRVRQYGNIMRGDRREAALANASNRLSRELKIWRFGLPFAGRMTGDDVSRREDISVGRWPTDGLGHSHGLGHGHGRLTLYTRTTDTLHGQLTLYTDN